MDVMVFKPMLEDVVLTAGVEDGMVDLEALVETMLLTDSEVISEGGL